MLNCDEMVFFFDMVFWFPMRNYQTLFIDTIETTLMGIENSALSAETVNSTADSRY